MSNSIYLLMIIPVIFAFLYLVSSKQMYYKILSGLFFVAATYFSISLALNGPQNVLISGGLYHTFENVILVIELLITLYLLWTTIKNKRWPVFLLTVVSAGLSIYATLFMGKSEEVFLNVDKLSIVMALIVNIIGTLIILFSNEYMKHYEEHRKMKSKQKLYYFVICIFLSAMNGLVFSDSLMWVYFFWEITTVSSFVLISYNNDAEALNSGFRALFLNLIGGISFMAGIIIFKNILNIDSISGIIQSGKLVYAIPVILLCIAGFTKSAQLPFQSWLLGAMVAPTPVSALLHSSTMVNAGVYLIVKLSPAYANTSLGTAIAIFGGFSFFVCSAIAVSQRNAKRVLAYSTIANLGLVISCAGMGSSIAISAAILLIIFHAVSKALLFLCTGQIEHVIGSRDIEDMSGLIRKAPILTLLCVFGILSMILPPFGVLITKWISIEASASNPILVILLILGSALTSVFWIKWLGTLLSFPVNDLKPKYHLDFTTYFPLGILGVAILAASAFITSIFNLFVSPEVTQLLKVENQLLGNHGNISSQLGSFNGAIIFIIIVAIVVVFLLIKKLILSPHIKKVYLCGGNNQDSSTGLKFTTGIGSVEKAVVSNMYLPDLIDEKKFTIAGYIVSIAILLIIFIGGLL